MEFIKANYLQTSTQIVVQSNTVTAENILNPDITYQYYSDGYADDNTTTTLRINFDSTTTISRIAIMGHNLKDYLIYYNGATASTFSFTTTSSTSTSSFATNSETSQYFFCTPVDCTSVSFDLKKTMVANSEKAIGYIVLSDIQLDFERLPSSKSYLPMVDPKQVVHTMSDGGTRIHTVKRKKSAQIKFKNITTEFRDDLKDVFDLHTNMIFVAFGTATAWDKIIFDCVWVGDFEFYKFSDDAIASGFSGSINLKETAD